MTTYQEVVLESPTKAGVSVATEVIPAAPETVRADSLLPEAERKVAASRGLIFGVEFEGMTYLVPAHSPVPAQATVPRTASGALVGVAGVSGG